MDSKLYKETTWGKDFGSWVKSLHNYHNNLYHYGLLKTQTQSPPNQDRLWAGVGTVEGSHSVCGMLEGFIKMVVIHFVGLYQFLQRTWLMGWEKVLRKPLWEVSPLAIHPETTLEALTKPRLSLKEKENHNCIFNDTWDGQGGDHPLNHYLNLIYK